MEKTELKYPIVPYEPKADLSIDDQIEKDILTQAEEDDPDWLDDAIVFDVYNSSDKRLSGLVDFVFNDISLSMKVSNKSRTKAALKTILINLWQGFNLGLPVRYSRRKKDYSRPARYGQIYLKYDRVIPVIDTLKKKGYIHGKPGFFRAKTKRGKQSRMWASSKLITLFFRFGLIIQTSFEPETEGFIIAGDNLDIQYKEPAEAFFMPARKEEPIVLNNREGNPIKYNDSNTTKQWRDNLHRYNKFVDKHELTLVFDKTTGMTYRFLLDKIFRNIISNRISVLRVALDWHSLEKLIEYIHNSSNIIHINNLPNNHRNKSDIIITTATFFSSPPRQGESSLSVRPICLEVPVQVIFYYVDGSFQCKRFHLQHCCN